MLTRRVLIVEDEVLFGELLRRTLSGEPGLDVVGLVQDGATALQLARELKPDAVIMDIELAGEMDGIEAARQIKRESPQTGIVILSSHNDRRYVTSLPLTESAGWSYLLKQTVTDVGAVVRAILGSIDGLVVLDPAVVSVLRPRAGSPLARLTARQREVLELMAQGYNNATIAQRLVLTEKSVETYINTIYGELGLSGERGHHARVRATLIYLEASQNR